MATSSIDYLIKNLPIPAVWYMKEKIAAANAEFLHLSGVSEISGIVFIEWLGKLCGSDKKAFNNLVRSFEQRQKLSAEVSVPVNGMNSLLTLVSVPVLFDDAGGHLIFFYDHSADIYKKQLLDSQKALDDCSRAAKEAEIDHSKKLEEANQLSSEIEQFAYKVQKQTVELKTANEEINRVGDQLRKRSEELASANRQLKDSIEKEKEMAALKARSDAEKKRAEELLAVNQQLRANEQQLRSANQQLRTKEQALGASQEELRKKVKDLESFNRLMVGRELEMINLKQRINDLLKELGRPEEYEKI